MVMPDFKIPKTFVRQDNTAVVTCQHCGHQEVILADPFKGYKYKLKVKCECQNDYIVILEFRSRVRKKTRLSGTYTNHSQNDRTGSFSILDISVTGLGFTSQDAEYFKEDDKLTVEFTLDDDRKTKIRKEVIVRYRRQDSVGCEFNEREDPFESPLGNYVMTNLNAADQF